MSSSSSDDFNTKDLVLALSANFEQPHRFAEIFCKAAQQQKSIDDVLKSIIREVLKHDKDTIDHIKTVQRQVNKEDFKNLAKQIWIGGLTLITVIITALVTAFIQKYI